MADNFTQPNTGSPDPNMDVIPGGYPAYEPPYEEEEPRRNAAAVVLATLLTLLVLALILVLCLIFVPGAPLNTIINKDGTTNSSMVDADKYDANGHGPNLDAVKGKDGKEGKRQDGKTDKDGLLKGGNAGQSDPKAVENLKGNQKLNKQAPAKFNLSLPQGYQLSATSQPVGKNATYRIVNPCGQVTAGTDCTSADFAVAVADSYEQSGGVQGPMEFNASSATTGQTYHVKCDAQNGGKVLCLGGRNDSAGIVITKTK